MTNSLRQTSILIFSILAMLVSSYVSSMPMMDMNQVPSFSGQVAHPGSMEKSQMTANQHTIVGCPPMEIQDMGSERSIHCDGSSAFGNDCCNNVCSSAFFPLTFSRLISTSDSDLTLRHPIKIGVTTTRIQSLLRPPSV